MRIARRSLPPDCREGWIDPSEPARVARVREALVAAGITVRDLQVDVEAYRAYVREARYAPTMYTGNFTEKTLEHFLSLTLLDPQPGETWIDIANADGPTPEILTRLRGVRAWRQDLVYPEGIHGDRIGGDAGAMPVADGFADAMSLHCSLEHFEGDADRRFARSLDRVLSARGRVCIAPLYLCDEHAVLSDPAAWWPTAPRFDDGARVYLARGYNNRHGRLYAPERLAERVASALGPLTLTVHQVVNATEVDPSCYVRWVGVIARV